MAIKIEVTAEDIRDGERECGDSCPIALAAQRSGVFMDPYVDVYEMRWTDSKDNGWEAGLPLAAQDFVRKFDGGEPVEPFSFEITGSIWDEGDDE